MKSTVLSVVKRPYLHVNICIIKSDSHCSECVSIWFEWQNRAVEREMEKWIEYNKGLILIS